MKTADEYIEKVLADLPRSTPLRDQIGMELRGHIAERLDGGAPVEDVLRQLGTPMALAESYLSAVPLVSAPFLRRAAAKLLDGAVVLAAMALPALLVGGLVRPARRPRVRGVDQLATGVRAPAAPAPLDLLHRRPLRALYREEAAGVRDALQDPRGDALSRRDTLRCGAAHFR